ncbi:dynamin family protein [Rummeliibacillus sp. JY-2-4R]
MTEFEQHIQKLLKQTAVQYLIYEHNEDEERIQKTKLFAEKLLNKEYMIAFAGHFSAGKSSMINALTGEDLLPSSPIPTSANVVKVHKSAQNYAIAYLTGQDPVKFDENYDIRMVKEFAKNGALVSQIEIGHKDSVLPEGITVMDTPGVDSTDDAHRMSTESALHLADIVFYVMDYNHVQSELNFQFTKNLMKYNPNLYLIVNQIDKHKENELSFEDFSNTVHTSFANWGVNPKGIFFTSLRDQTLPYNDFKEVKQIVMNSMNGWQKNLLDVAEKTLQQLHVEHEQYLLTNKQELLGNNEEILSSEDWEIRDEIKSDYQTVLHQLKLYSASNWLKSFDDERDELLENAATAIVPFELREKLREYLESIQPNFKMGMFFAAKKTQAEQKARKDALYELYCSITASQVSGHLKALMKKALKEVNALTDDMSNEIDSFELKPPMSVIEEQVKLDSGTAGDALLNFANRVSSATIRWFKQSTDDWKFEKAKYIEELSFTSVEPLKKKCALLKSKVEILEAVEVIEQQEKYFTIQKSVSSETKNEEAEHYVTRWTEDHIAAFEKIRIFDPSMLVKEEQMDIEEVTEEQDTSSVSIHTATALQNALKTANAVAPIQGFQEVANYLTNKVKRLDKKDFTIALFGAFSAGKSSFSNALLGQKVLPVSPNPTTAAINKIRPVSEENPHETADVHLKTAEQLKEDIIASFGAIGIQVTSLEDAFDKVDKALARELEDERLHVHKSFIRAFKEGYSEFKEKLGTTIQTNREEFEKFVAQENRSCFVDTIDFYYDCALTRLGVTLVDTPGADSINARHTGVAFEYIRNADAILFITYYNHAFAKADREFLIQLGRVKDAFELDKMFFVVNAIDLASNDEEEADVKAYVKQELQRFGIRKPRLFGVSSLLALQEKVENTHLDSGMASFEENFHHFLSEELTALAVQALAEETEKTQERLRLLIQNTEDNLKRKDERLVELAKLEQYVHTRYMYSAAPTIEKDTVQELDELLYYVLQRVYYRYPDFFKEGYNPTTFATKSSTVALELALKEVLASLSFDFEQEMRVTNFRLAKFILKKIQERYVYDTKQLQDVNNGFSFMPFEVEEPNILEFTGPFQNTKPYEGVKSFFKNSKSFFEKGDFIKLREALEDLTKPDAKQYLDVQAERMKKWSEAVITKEAEELRLYISKQAIEQIDLEKSLLQEGSKLNVWKEIYESLIDGVKN